MSAPWGSKERPWPIAVSDLDSFTYYRGAENMTAEDFANRLNRVREISAPLIIGKAFHNAIERKMIEARTSDSGLSLETFTGESDDLRVDFQTYGLRDGKELECSLTLYNIVEQDVELVFQSPEGWIQLRGVIDGLYGTIVRDLKTTKNFKAEKFQDSWQWRAYLIAMGALYERFEYHVFTVQYGKGEEANLAANKPATVGVIDYNMIPCHRYPAMMRDLQGITAELAAYLKLIKWEPPAKRQMQIF